MSAAVAVTKVQLRILRNDPWFLVIMFGMPLVVMPLLKDTIGLSLVSSGFEGATGAELVVPGQAVLFGFFVGGSAGFCVFREHGSPKVPTSCKVVCFVCVPGTRAIKN